MRQEGRHIGERGDRGVGDDEVVGGLSTPAVLRRSAHELALAGDEGQQRVFG